MVIMFYVFFIKSRGLKYNTGNNVNGKRGEWEFT